MTKKPIFSHKTKFRPKKRISEKISYICTVRATEANDQPCNIRLSAPRRTPRNDDDVHVHVEPQPRQPEQEESALGALEWDRVLSGKAEEEVHGQH